MAERTFALDLAFDWNLNGALEYSFSERNRTIQVPSRWHQLEEKDGRIWFGTSKDKSYLRVAVWGRNVNPAGAELLLKLFFEPGCHPREDQGPSPFDEYITATLAQGIPLDENDAFYTDGSDTVWIVNPYKAVGQTARLRERRDSVLWFNYFPEMTCGDFALSMELDVKIAKKFTRDPEMEVGEDDDEGDEGDEGDTGGGS